MRPTSIFFVIAAFGVATVGLPADSETNIDSPRDTKLANVDRAESLSEAVSRLNTEVSERFGVLSPTPLTVPRVKSALEATVKDLLESDTPHRDEYASTLTHVLREKRIPSSARFIVVPIIGTYSKEQKEKHRDGRHVDISINYVLEVPNGKGIGRRAIGLTTIVEAFRITKPKEQKKPLDPPTETSLRN